MAKNIKLRFFGTRVDQPTFAKIKEYVEIAETDLSQLVRNAIAEYMANHPVKNPSLKNNSNKVLKPGE